MSAPISLRGDFDGPMLRALALCRIDDRLLYNRRKCERNDDSTDGKAQGYVGQLVQFWSPSHDTTPAPIALFLVRRESGRGASGRPSRDHARYGIIPQSNSLLAIGPATLLMKA